MPLERGTDRQVIRINDAGACSFETNDRLDSIDGLSSFSMLNDNLTASISDGVDTIEAIDITHDITNIRGGSSEFRMTDRPAGVRITRSGVTRLSMTTDDTSLFNGDNNTRFQLFNKSCQILTQDTGGTEHTRVLIDTVQSRFNAPNEQQRLLLTDSTFQISSAADNYLAGTSNTILGVSGGTPRFQIAPTVSDLIAPSGVSKVRVFDDRVETNVRIKVLANSEVSGQHFVGQLIGDAQSNVYSTSNTRVGLCVDGSLTQTADLQVWAKNNVGIASVSIDGKASFPNMSSDLLDARAANPLQIAPATATSVDISKPGSLTTVKGGLEVDEATRLEGGASVGTVAAGFTLPSVRATTAGQVITSDALGNCSWTGSNLYWSDVNCETQTATPIAVSGTYYVVAGLASTDSAGFAVTAGLAEITYTGSEPIRASLYAGLSAQSENLAGLDTATFRMALYKNGVRLVGFSTSIFDTTVNFPSEMSLARTVSLSNGDVIQMRVSNQTDTRNLIVDNYTLSIHKIGK